MIVYVAGPYRGLGSNRLIRFIRRSLNIIRAWKTAMELWRQGFTVICPHANSAWMDGAGAPDWFLEGDLEILARCDVLYLMPDFYKSEGALKEYQFCIEHNIPVVKNIYELVELEEKENDRRNRP